MHFIKLVPLTNVQIWGPSKSSYHKWWRASYVELWFRQVYINSCIIRFPLQMAPEASRVYNSPALQTALIICVGAICDTHGRHTQTKNTDIDKNTCDHLTVFKKWFRATQICPTQSFHRLQMLIVTTSLDHVEKCFEALCCAPNKCSHKDLQKYFCWGDSYRLLFAPNAISSL